MRGRVIILVVAATLFFGDERSGRPGGNDARAAAPNVTGKTGEPRPPIILRGQRLILVARVGAVTAQVEAEALQDGCKEDTIQVKNLYSGKVQSARITRAGRAEVLR